MNASSAQYGKHGRAAAGLLAWAFAAALQLATAPAAAASIENTATVTYQRPGEGVTVLKSNTVVAQVLPLPTPAQLSFLRYDPDAAGSQPIAIDGGQCRVEGGSFAPLPGVVDGDGNPLDPDNAQTDTAPGYYTGEPIVVSVADVNRNADPAVREYVDVDITTTTGDAETLRLQETGPNTGVFAGAIQSVPIPPAATQYDCGLSLAAFAQITARYTDTDFPLDALAVAAAGYAPLQPGKTVIRLEQSVSKSTVEIGDFLQYTLVVRNSHDAPAINARIRDVLPPGFRYQPGSLRVGNASTPGGPVVIPNSVGAVAAAARRVSAGMLAASDPVVSGDGRTLQFPVGDLAPGGSVTAMFVVEVGSGASAAAYLLNYAIAHANGALASNETDTLVTMRQSLLASRFTIIGRVFEAESCDVAPDKLKGIANVRLLLEDGTYVPTDENGAYHFEGVRPGTHVVQVDLATLPPDLEVAPCLQNTRFAGRGYSQFVEAQGGALWRSDFYLRRRQPQGGTVGLNLKATMAGERLQYAVDLDGGEVAVSHLRAMVVLPEGTQFVPGSATVDGGAVGDPQFTGNVAIFELGDPGARWRRQLRVDVLAQSGCPPGGYEAKAVGLFEAGGKPGRTPPAAAALACGPPPPPADSGRVETTVAATAAGPVASPFAEQEKNRKAILDDIAAAGGGDIDWFKDQAAGQGWLFPATDYNPRSPTTRAVVKHMPGQKVSLRINGEPVPGLSFDGSRTSGDKTVAVSIWRGLPLLDGDNQLQADILDKDGTIVASLTRVVHYANVATRAELVPGESILVADGIHAPVIAVRMLDRSGRPVRAGITGEFDLQPPYTPAQTVQMQQQRQLAGLDGAKPTWHIEGDNGIAYIELQPTSVAGSVAIGLQFRQSGQQAQRVERQELQAWLKSQARDWVVVGFAAGSVGYETLKDNMQALPEGEDGSGVRSDGQVSLYAKGRVLGKWMLTLAYDSDKPTDRLRNQNLLSTIDPNQYYTLYGDGTQQGYDAASARKLYLKLERDQFYALFGDFQTGLDRNELSRYQRTLNGVKVEYRGALVEFNGFAAKTSQSYARDELQGDGTSGLYRLKRSNIVINSERIRIETRDRYHSEQIIGTRELARHIDYDIDYDNGTLFFREPIASRDFDFNPNWIVAEYETGGTTEEFLNGGGRVGVRLMGDRLQAGVSYIRDEDAQARSQLAGVDAKFRLTEHDELRAEAAASRSEAGADDSSGNAWLLEWEHRSEQLNLLAYARRQAGAFGLGQQNRTESGMFKAGVQGQYRLDKHFSLNGEAYRLENLASDAVRNAAQVQVAYQAEEWNARAGLQWAQDKAADGKLAESRQVTLGASRFFFGKKLELSIQGDFSLGGKNESVDFPTRLQLGAAYRINEAFRILAAQEFTDGKERDTSTTRIGFEAKPWKDATLTSTLNQSQISEYGPRTFALLGLNQKFLVGKHWGLDVAVDSSQAFNQSNKAPLVVDPSQPIQAGGIRDGGALTENFVALSGGATYRAELWSWNARLEGRQGDNNDRYGITSAFLRQARDGVALSASLQAFSQHNADGSTGLLANAQLSWAYRVLGSRWSMLDKLEFRLDEITSGTGAGILGNNTIAANGDARSARIINNFVLNYVSDAWNADGGAGSVLDLNQRSQLSLYYGSKYVLDSFDGDDYSGYSDILGAEWRFDVNPRIDVGIRASVMHSWRQNTFAWAFGPTVGFSPFTNSWVSVGYNIRGFNDRDFESSHYTAQGPYLMLRMKFDQGTFGLDRGAAAPAP
jgi:uncharacterized repeat protein (TIGR01451 family)